MEDEVYAKSVNRCPGKTFLLIRQAYVSGYHIIFHITGQSDKYYNINKNNTFIDQSAHLVYQGAEKK